MCPNTTPPPTGRDPEQWLAWLADAPCTSGAVDTAIEADMGHRIVCAAIGMWIARNRLDEVATRFAETFVKLDQFIPAR